MHHHENKNKTLRLSLNNSFHVLKACVEHRAHCSVSKTSALPWKVFGLREDSTLSYLFISAPFFVPSKQSAFADLILNLKIKLTQSSLRLFDFALSLCKV